MLATRSVSRPTQFIAFALLLALLGLSITWLTNRLDANAQIASGFSAGQNGVTIGELYLRADASRDGTVVQVLPAGAYLELLYGPTTAGDFLADAATSGTLAVGD